jgi:hypothetical protein
MFKSPSEIALASQARPNRNWIHEAMTNANSFIAAQIKLRGLTRGADEVGHQFFQVTRTQGPELYGDYFEILAEKNTNDYNIEIREFGHVVPQQLGSGPAFRQHFSAEECLTVEELIRSLFSMPDIFKGKYRDAEGRPPVRFLGGISFRPNWISRHPPDETASPRAHNGLRTIIHRAFSAIPWRPGSGS